MKKKTKEEETKKKKKRTKKSKEKKKKKKTKKKQQLQACSPLEEEEEEEEPRRIRMQRFFSKVSTPKSANESTSSRNQQDVHHSTPNPVLPPATRIIDLNELPADPGLRKNIHEYDINDRENVRRWYLQKGPCQPRNYHFPGTIFSGVNRSFVGAWFGEYDWLEYSISKDAADCLVCYLFKPNYGHQGGGDAFVGEGFRNWKKKSRFSIHVGAHNSTHNQCSRACSDLLLQRQHIEVCLSNQSQQIQADYRIRLTASIDCIRFLLSQGLAFRGHDESENSENQGNFLELLSFLANHNEEINNVVLKNAPENHKLTSPRIQKDIVSAIASETTNAIIREVGDGLFAILVDEARDISVKEQMAVALRFVDDRGCIVERFLGIVHVSDTTALSLKKAIEALFSCHGLSLSSIRGQGYDGASNMRGEFHGLKALFMMENPAAHYIHCFAHQLQLTLVAVAKNHTKIGAFFDIVALLSNVVGASCKRRDLLREKQFEKLIQRIGDGEILTGRGLNQETTLQRPGDTRWGSHFGTIVSLINLFSSVIDVLLVIGKDAHEVAHRIQADDLCERIQSFQFVFCLHLMKMILGITNDLSQALQRKDQDIVNAINIVKITKQTLQRMRDGGWESLLNEVSLFCTKYGIGIPNMEAKFEVHGRSRRNVEECTNLHYYRVELFYSVIDLQLQELNNRFTEVNTELLLCMSCLDPADSFSAFDMDKLIRFAEFYPSDFDEDDISCLGYQLSNYIEDVRTSEQFFDVIGISGLARKMVQTKRHRQYSLVFLLMKLALILPVATATVERVFSAMKIIKTQLRNRLGDEFMNDCLIAYIEKDMSGTVSNEDIIQRFQKMCNRRGVL